MNLYELTAHQIIKDKVNPRELRQALEERIARVDKKIKAVLRLCPPQSIGALHKASSDARQGSVASALAGIPIAIKDNICIKDNLTTCASHILDKFKPPYDATVITKLRNAGANLLCSTNMDEFAFGSSTENSFYGPTHNPWDTARVPGGSSGGSAAAVAAGEATIALGSDTGGSIRQPASFCGVVGLKPTYGRVSRYGLIAFGSSLDQIGPLTKDVHDSALLLNVIAGYDPNDSTSVDTPVPDYTKSLVKDVKGLKIGIPKEYLIEGIDKEVKDAVWAAINLLKKIGTDYKEISLPHTEYAVPTYYIVATSEASSNLARFDGVQYGLRSKAAKKEITDLIDMYFKTRQDGFGKEAKRRIMLGTYALSAGYYEAYYLRALKVRTLIKRDFDEAFKSVDCIITPTSPTPAFKIGEKMEDPLSMYLSDIFTISANLAGIPGISIPCGFTPLESNPLTGFTKNNLPIGLQILAKPFAEETLFRVAYTYEQNTEWHRKKPKL